MSDDVRDKAAEEWMKSPAPIHNASSGQLLRECFKDGWNACASHKEEERVSAMMIELKRIMNVLIAERERCDAWKDMAHKLAKEVVGCDEEWAQDAYEEYKRFREGMK